MRRARDVLVLIILVALAARIIWWSVEPLLPAVLIGLALLLIIGTIVRRQRTW